MLLKNHLIEVFKKASLENNLLLNDYLDLENFLNKIWEKDSPLNK